ncbi:MAG: hypothetical protein FWF44_05840 [Defluviitaleaceae bacterium]|nr:hypothetical protein [Defluviitaleaceae bacterium]
MALTTIQTPLTPQELVNEINANVAALDQAKADVTDLADYIPTSQKGANGGVATLDSSGNVVQKANSAAQADNYNASAGTIKTGFDSVNSEISNIKTGATTVGKAATLDPATPPGGDMFFGTSSSGTPGWLPQSQLGAGSAPSLGKEPFTIDDARWDTGVNGLYTLTIADDGYPLAAFMQDGSVWSQVFVELQTDGTNAYVRANATFAGYVVMG